MTSATVPPPQATASSTGTDGGAAQIFTPSSLNQFRLSAVSDVMDRLTMHITGKRNDPVEFFHLCLSFSRGIDFAAANNEVLSRVQELPLFLKMLCQRKTDIGSLAAIMVLMISIKNACKLGWFSDKDTDELLKLVNKIGSNFSTAGNINSEPSDSLQTVSKIMSRFYPRIKMGQVIGSLEVKPGYGTFMVDFLISKNSTPNPPQDVKLLVSQTDNTETSACITSPPLVNFLLNGKPVEKRTNLSVDTGPQIPTNVTPMLKYGTNLLQAVGQFNGHYIIVVAYMTVSATADTVALQDYVQHVSAPASDSEIIEGSSRISLNCPISFRRIKTPIKGHLCKHLQCFDLDNYVDINSRRPSWRCPHCNQYVCYPDMRIDQYMVKVLSEVGEDVADVIISADGSWKAVTESNGSTEQSHDDMLHSREEMIHINENIMDLTSGGDEINVEPTHETEDRKPLLSNLQSQFVPESPTPQIEDQFWSGVFLSTLGAETPSARADTPISEPSPTHLTSSLTDAVSLLENQLQTPNNLQLQPSQFVQSLVSHEYGRLPAVPRHVTRTPIAVQALAAPGSTPVAPQRSRTNMNSSILNGLNNIDRQHQLSRAFGNTGQGSGTTSSLQHRSTQNQDTPTNQPGSQIVGRAAPHQLPGGYRVPHEPQNSNPQQPINMRMPHTVNQHPSTMRFLARTQVQQGGPNYGPASTASGQNSRLLAAVHRAAQAARQTPSAATNVQASSPRMGGSDGIRNTEEMAQPVSRTENMTDWDSAQNWRPTGQMRGSLSGSAYSAALRQFMTQPTQPLPQTSRPLPTTGLRTPNVPPTRPNS